MNVFNNPIVVGLAIGFPASVLGYLAYRRTIKLDRAAAASAVATTQSDAVKQVIEGLNTINENLQEDNEVLRQNLKELGKLLETSLKENRRLKKEAANLNRKYNGK